TATTPTYALSLHDALPIFGVGEGLKLTRQTFAPAVAAYLAERAPRLAIVDSIQTLTYEEGAVPGSVTQVRDATALLVASAKEARSEEHTSELQSRENLVCR